jgi:Mn2+/Fe2+ NRAMP family transporter
MNHIKEMIPMLKPLFGPAALFVFATGIMAAGTSSYLPNMMVIPWLTDDLKGNPRNTRTGKKRVALGLLTVISILGVFIKRPVFLLLLSQVGISVVMPMGLLGLMYLSACHIKNKEHRPNPIEWVLLGLISCFSLFISGLAIRGLITDISSRL